MDRFLREVETRTAGLARRPRTKTDGSETYRWRIPVPRLRAAVREGYSFFGGTDKRVAEVWNFIWRNTNCYEVMSQALYYYQSKSLSPTELTSIKKWIQRCDCWEHSDDLSKIYAQVVEEQPQRMLPTLHKWNKSRNRWKRRHSLVSLIEYASKRRRFRPFVELISFVEPLLSDDEYYVQKAVGWTLREIGNAYPRDTERFLKEHAVAIHPLAWSAATQKLNKDLKAKLNDLRRSNRAES